MAEQMTLTPQRGQGLVDVLDRILDKGLVIAGDIRINVGNIELLTIRIRLLLCSIDKAEQIGINWWRTDPSYQGPVFAPSADYVLLSTKLDEVVRKLEALEQTEHQGTSRRSGTSARKE